MKILIKYLILLIIITGCASKQLISDKSTIDGAIKNLDELNRWFFYDYKQGDISEKTLREYGNLVELVKYQLKDIKYKGKEIKIK